jgi:glyoxylate/hydroxypyruvate reductase A
MPRGATLIQLGRGEHLVEEDLLHALDSGQIGGASLDVFREEPLSPAHPFWAHPAVRVTPHEASVTSPATVAKTLARSVAALMAGERPPAAVDRKIGY